MPGQNKAARMLFKLFSGDTRKADALKRKMVGKRLVRRDNHGAVIVDSLIKEERAPKRKSKP